MTSLLPLVSIILPCHNSEKYLEPCLQSCVDQSYQKWECVIVDDGSEDSTLRIAEKFSSKYPHRFHVVKQSKSGPSAARNAALRVARGEYVYFLDSDDLAAPSALQSLAEAAREGNHDAVYGNWANFFSDGSQSVVDAKPQYPGDMLASWIRVLPANASFILRRPKRLFREDLWVNEMVELTLHEVAESQIAYVNKTLGLIRSDPRPERLTSRFDHFDPVDRARLFGDYKHRLSSLNRLTVARAEALDVYLLHAIYRLFRERRARDARRLVHYLERNLIRQYTGFKPLGLTGFAYYLGPYHGIRLFAFLNRILGRN